MKRPPTPTGEFKNLFRCTGADRVAASMDGKLALVEIIEASGKTITVSFPPEAAPELANRFLAAAQIAEDRKRAGAMPETGDRVAPVAPLVTDHQVQVSDDANTLVLTLRTGTTPLQVQVSKNRSVNRPGFAGGSEP